MGLNSPVQLISDY